MMLSVYPDIQGFAAQQFLLAPMGLTSVWTNDPSASGLVWSSIWTALDQTSALRVKWTLPWVTLSVGLKLPWE